MQCTPTVAVAFTFCAVAYGASSAVVAEGMKYFTPNLVIMFRMLYGCITCFLIMIFRMIFQPGYTQIVRAHFTSGVWPVLHIIIGGMLNLGIPHTMIAIAQLWIPSAAVQLAKPLTPLSSAIVGHFLLEDEHFTRNKGIALVSAILGVSLSAVPAFNHAGALGVSISNIIFGYVLLIVAVILFGLAAVYFRWKTPNTDLTISSMVQTGGSTIFSFIWCLAYDTPSTVFQQIRDCPPIGWLWPIILGAICSGVAVHCFMYLVSSLGPIGAGFVPFGQIIVGVTLGVTWKHEWATYSWWEILLNLIGVVFLGAAIVIGFSKEKTQEEKEETEVEQAQSDEDSSSMLDEI